MCFVSEFISRRLLFYLHQCTCARCLILDNKRQLASRAGLTSCHFSFVHDRCIYILWRGSVQFCPVLSNEYQHDRLKVDFKILCIFVIWTKVTLALESFKPKQPELELLYLEKCINTLPALPLFT